MDSTPSLSDLIDTSRYRVKEKGNETPAMPLESAINVYRWFEYNMGDESTLSLSLVIRWALLYEVLSHMQYTERVNFERHKKNSMPFITEWLDDLLLLNWGLEYERIDLDSLTYVDFIYWDGTKLQGLPFNILKYCKHCLEEMNQPFSFNSLHDDEQHGQDCSKYYYNPKRNTNFGKNFEMISSIKNKLHKVMYKIYINNVNASHKKIGPDKFLSLFKEYLETLQVEPQEVLLKELNSVIGECSEELIVIAKEWHNKLNKLKEQPFYKDANFNAVVNIKDSEKFYCPKLTHKKYKSFNTIKRNSKDIREIYEQIDSLHREKQYDYDFIDLLRRLFLYK